MIKAISIIATILGSGDMFAGCHGTGGGWMRSAAGEPYRATIGLDMQCADRSGSRSCAAT